MSQGMTTSSIRWALERLREKIAISSRELNELDGAIGDGDLGVTLVRAADGLAGDASNLPDDVGMALLRCAQTLSRVSAGTYGTLLATGLMSAAKATKGRTEVPWGEMSALLAGALKAISDRSKGQLGDKTVLDAIDSARQAMDGLEEPAVMVKAANEAIASAIDHFRDLPFRQGRARIFGTSAIGKADPGMVAFKRIIEALA